MRLIKPQLQEPLF